MSTETDVRVAAIAWSVIKLAVGGLVALVFVAAGLGWLRDRDAMVAAVTIAVALIVAFALYSIGRTVWQLLH